MHSAHVPLPTTSHSNGDLLMDIPCNISWDELKDMAANRKAWRKRVHAIKTGGHPTTTTTTPNTPLKQPTPVCTPVCNHDNINPQSPTAGTPNPNPGSRTKHSAKKYRRRDQHALFFRAPEKRRRRRDHKPKLKKPRPLTNKERTAFAREYYNKHHGNVANTPPWAVPAPRPDLSPVISPPRSHRHPY